MKGFVKAYLNWRALLIVLLWAAVPVLAAQVLLADNLPAGRPGLERCGCTMWMATPGLVFQGSLPV